jgi:hypothetical protein
MKRSLLLPNLLPTDLISDPEQLVDSVGGLLAKLGQDMGVGVHRHPDLGMAEHFHDGARGHALGKQESGASVSSRQISTAHSGTQTEYALLAMLSPGGPSSQRPAPGRIIEDTQRRAKHGRLR